MKKKITLSTTSQYTNCKASWPIALAAYLLRSVASSDVKDDSKFVHARPNSAACEVNHSNHPGMNRGNPFALKGTGKQQISKKATDLAVPSTCAVMSPAHAQCCPSTCAVLSQHMRSDVPSTCAVMSQHMRSDVQQNVWLPEILRTISEATWMIRTLASGLEIFHCFFFLN